MIKPEDYRIDIFPEYADGKFIAYVSYFPPLDLYSQGATAQEAEEAIREAIKIWGAVTSTRVRAETRPTKKHDYHQGKRSGDDPMQHRYEYRAKLKRVVDGDTVDLTVDAGFYSTFALRFRLLGVDTPEIRDRDGTKREEAKRAKEAVEKMLDLAGDWPLRIETHKADSFGRWLARVFYPVASPEGKTTWQDVTETLLAVGLGVPYQGRHK